MSLFGKIFGKQSGIAVGAPVDGEAIAISKVKDETFSQEILGKGAGVIPSTCDIVSPVNGTVDMIFPTGHAFTMTSEDGVEVLVHIGIDTVNLQGKHFEKLVEAGSSVTKGTPVIHADIEAIKADGYDATVVTVICNTDQFQSVIATNEGLVSKGVDIINITK